MSKLVDYGIQNEGSDIRAHVSPTAGGVYVYPTSCGVEAIQKHKFKTAPAYQKGIKTALGYLVPPSRIKHARFVEVPGNIWDRVSLRDSDKLGVKGEKAVRVVRWLLISGRFPLWTHGGIVADKDMQISGLDIVVSGKWKIQVKCDYNGGDRDGCTGNLYLQIAESNPFGIY